MTRQPETLGQARTWDRVKRNYMAAGLCSRCSAQLAWGHQIGFARLEHRPCAGCVPGLASLPVAKSGGWRVFDGEAAKAPLASAGRDSMSVGGRGASGTLAEAAPTSGGAL